MKNVSKETIVRTSVLFITLVNSVLTMFGINPLPFSENDIYQAISAVCTAAATIWAWWKNNSFTKPAIEGDKVKDELKIQAKIEKLKAKEEKLKSEVDTENETETKEDEVK